MSKNREGITKSRLGLGFRPGRVTGGAALLFIAGALVAGCGSSDGEGAGSSGSAGASGSEGDAAVWRLSDADAVSSDATQLDIEVTRLACASGETGDLLPARVSEEGERVVIQVDAVSLGDEGADCQANDWVAVTVDLDEPVGERELVDGACLEGPAEDTIYCETAVRWP